MYQAKRDVAHACALVALEDVRAGHLQDQLVGVVMEQLHKHGRLEHIKEAITSIKHMTMSDVHLDARVSAAVDAVKEWGIYAAVLGIELTKDRDLGQTLLNVSRTHRRIISVTN